MSLLPHAKVAVVTRTKNRPTLLRRALESVLSQTFDQYLLVVVNDAGDRASVDECVNAVANRAGGRILVVHNAESAGREAAMNVGLRHSSSDYLVIHDDDDTWDPEFLAQTVAHLDSNPQDGGVATRTEVIYERIENGEVTVDRREILASDMMDVTLFEMIRRNYTPPISLLYRRAVHDVVGEYAEELPVLADWDFNLRMLQRFPVGFIDGTPLAFWHHREHASGDLGNSVIADAQDHRAFDRTIRDRYLRDEIRSNSNLGSLLYLTELIDRGDQLDTVRHDQNLALLHNINNETAKFAVSLESRLVEYNDLVRTQAHQFRELNRNLVGQNNRLVAQLELLSNRISEVESLVFSQTPRQRVRALRALSRRKTSGLIDRLRRKAPPNP